jgi:sugar diacid utilization regulator
MPLEVRIEDLSQSICSRIVQKNNQLGSLNKILLDLIYGRKLTQGRVQKLMDYNYNPEQFYCSVVCICEEEEIRKEQTDEVQLFEEYEEEFLNKTARCMKSYMESVDRQILYVVDEGAIVLMLPIQKKGEATGLIRDMIPWVKDRVDLKTIRVGIGYPWKELDDFRDSVACAKHAIHFGEQMNTQQEIYDYSDLTAIRIFDEIEDKGMLRSIEKQVLGPITTGQADKELLRTLETYFQTDCNAKETAAALFVHENTMRYRVRKIENLLNKDLRNHNDVFELELAMRIREYLKYIQDSRISP